MRKLSEPGCAARLPRPKAAARSPGSELLQLPTLQTVFAPPAKRVHIHAVCTWHCGHASKPHLLPHCVHEVLSLSRTPQGLRAEL